ncbi:MAG: TetR/AcrR family transcriptional regulator C-terminal ligand-binding domain-containing protein [Oceanococcus sp.]
MIAAAATDIDARNVINELMPERIAWVESVFAAAEAHGELKSDAPVCDLVEMAIAVPYFRKFIAGLPLNQDWLDSHVNFICRAAEHVGDT